MTSKQVFVIWTHQLFQKSLALLLDHPQIELLGETCDYDSATQDIQRLRPNTVLIEETGDSKPKELINRLQSLPWNVRILSLNLMDNQLNFYHHEQRMMGNSEELVQVILSEMR